MASSLLDFESRGFGELYYGLLNAFGAHLVLGMKLGKSISSINCAIKFQFVFFIGVCKLVKGSTNHAIFGKCETKICLTEDVSDYQVNGTVVQ